MRTPRVRDFWKRYRRDVNEEKLGEGRYGSVVRAVDSKTGHFVAVKRVNVEDEHDDGIPSTTMREITILRTLESHPNIVKLREVFYDLDSVTGDREINLVLELLSCDLQRYIANQENPLEILLIKRLMGDLCSGIVALHDKGIFHRDLKPQNVLVDTTDETRPVLKIGDFGLGRTHPLPIQAMTHEIGSLHYRAPEILLGLKEYGHAVDIWSIGCIFAELLTGERLFRGTHEFGQIIEIFKVTGKPTLEEWPYLQRDISLDLEEEIPMWTESRLRHKFPDTLDPKAFDLLSRMLKLNPVDRIKSVDILKHPYFEEEEKNTGIDTPPVVDVHHPRSEDNNDSHHSP